ncbi:MAG: SUMF1/EgtB/PvdO family nonheme iron enzyme, partial [Planctomycetes bacterium]|nr:SUMF1/EgtB/PvdO family nonheme iron enzyme [Planctomycetota bacterium]
MRNSFLVVLVLSGLLVQLQGCKRKTPADNSQTSSNRPIQAATESGIEMVQIPGGRFTMGDKDEIDAAPHEVVLSSFYIDTYLVTQEHYQR